MRHTYVAVCLAVALSFSSAPGAQERVQETVVTQPANPLLAGVPEPFQFLFTGYIESGGQKEAWAKLPYDSITLERTACFGACPVYKVTFYRGSPKSEKNESYEDRFGRAELQVTQAGFSDGYRRNLFEDVGDFIGGIDLWTFARLSYLIQTFAPGLEDRYASNWTDRASTVVSVAGPGITRRILDYGGVGPNELWSIQQSIDSAAKSVDWKRK